jgi:hypothetical protein
MISECEIHSSDKWKVVVAKNFEEIEAIRPVWEQMQHTEPHPAPDADIDRFLSVVESFSDDVRPCVLLLKCEGLPAAMIIGRIEKHQLALRLGYKSLFKPTLRCLSVVYGGILGQPEGDCCSLLVGALLDQLRSREIDLIFFNNLRTSTALYEAVRKTPCFFTRGYFPTVNKHRRMSMPDEMDQFYEACSRGHRGSLRRAVRKYEQQYPGRDNFIKYASEDEVDDFVRIAAGVSSKTYQHALGVGLVNDEQTISRIRTAAKHGWFHGGILFAGDEPCAFQLGLCYKQIYYLVNLGYDPALKRHRVGTNLFLKVLESLCEDDSVHMFDFYFGDAEYKKRYGTTHWPEACIYIFAPRMYPVSVNALRCAVAGVNTTLGYVVNKTGVQDWIKRKRRNMLLARSSRIHAG